MHTKSSFPHSHTQTQKNYLHNQTHIISQSPAQFLHHTTSQTRPRTLTILHTHVYLHTLTQTCTSTHINSYTHKHPHSLYVSLSLSLSLTYTHTLSLTQFLSDRTTHTFSNTCVPKCPHTHAHARTSTRSLFGPLWWKQSRCEWPTMSLHHICLWVDSYKRLHLNLIELLLRKKRKKLERDRLNISWNELEPHFSSQHRKFFLPPRCPSR